MSERVKQDYDSVKGIDIVTEEHVRQRIAKIFEGIDLSQTGECSVGPVDFKVVASGTETRASASVHGFKFASFSRDTKPDPGEYTDIETFSLVGYTEMRGESSIWIQRRVKGTKFVITDAPIAFNNNGWSGSLEEANDSMLRSIGKMLKLPF